MERTTNSETSTHEDESHDVGLGGTTGGGILGGGTPTDIAEGRSAFHIEEPSAHEGGDVSGGLTTSGDETGTQSNASLPDLNAPVPIDHNPATSGGTTDAGLQAGLGSNSHTGGLISGGLPGESEDR